MEVDYIIIGQGVTGTFLSHYFIKEGKRVLVIDDANPNSASRVASGIVNPVTGRRVVETWMIDDLLPFAQQAYEDLGDLLSINTVKEASIINFHTTQQMLSAWNDRYNVGSDYIEPVRNIEDIECDFEVGLGAHKIFPSLLVDLESLLTAWQRYLLQQGCIINQHVDLDALEVTDTYVKYKDVSAEKVFFCNGIEAFKSEYFKKLPYSYNKGEAIIVKIEGLAAENVYKQALSIVPMKGDIFWVGSSFEWKFDDDLPSAAFRDKVETVLKSWLKRPYLILDHKASVRPASMERRPFVGMHPKHKNVGILNGMGTKGCSLAPYFAKQLVDHVIKGSSITPEADLSRFAKVLSA